MKSVRILCSWFIYERSCGVGVSDVGDDDSNDDDNTDNHPGHNCLSSNLLPMPAMSAAVVVEFTWFE